MEFRQVQYVNTNGLRNEETLSQETIKELKDFAVKLGMPEDRIVYSDTNNTSYGEIWDFLVIGTDVLPLKNRTKNPNSNISAKGALGHEIIGHREARFKAKTQNIICLEEAQASIRAARFTPELTFNERADLIRDAVYRLNKNGYKIRDVKDILYINER
jgi:hypothetical protein